jgi:hypothetical protein
MSLGNEPKRAIAFEGQVPEEQVIVRRPEGKRRLVNVNNLKIDPTSNMTPAQQALVLRYYLEGNNYRTIARKIHRGERAVSRLCRCPAIADKIQEVKELIVGQAEDWAESLNFAVRTEEDGAMALKLSQAFGAVPPSTQKLEVSKPMSQEDLYQQYKMRAAWQLGLCAMERAEIFNTPLPLEKEELDARVQKSIEAETKQKSLAEEMKG